MTVAPAADRVLVTGIGLETCLGNDPKGFWDAVANGRSGIAPISGFDATGLSCHVAGEVDFDPGEVMTPTEVRRSSRTTQLLVSAGLRAVADAGLPSMQRAAIVVGTGGGGNATLGEILERDRGRGMASDRFVLMKTLPNMPATHLAERLGVTGPVQTVTTACAASTDAMGLALWMLRRGEVDVVLAGGVETWVTRSSLEAFARIHALSRRPASEAASASRPFDAQRDGMVPADGAAVLVLERAGARRSDDGPPYGELLGAGSSCDAFHPVKPRPGGTVAAAALERALRDAGVGRDEIGMISAHGTSTPLNDVVETEVLRAVFGEQADRIPVTAPKSVLGHASGACGTIEAAAALLALHHQFVPPTANLTDPDPRCDLDYTPCEGRAHAFDLAVSCNFGFGGQNAAVVLGRVDA